MIGQKLGTKALETKVLDSFWPRDAVKNGLG